jgi:hypothetical protein
MGGTVEAILLASKVFGMFCAPTKSVNCYITDEYAKKIVQNCGTITQLSRKNLCQALAIIKI